MNPKHIILLPQAPSILCEMKRGDVLVSQIKTWTQTPAPMEAASMCLSVSPALGVRWGEWVGETSRSQGLTGQLKWFQVQCKNMFSVNKDRV